MEKKRELSIEWMKFVAALLIVNSHIGVCYGKYEALATGGAIGNALFFFCSGYTLSLGRFDRFDNWMKRRIFRLYPSVIAKSLIVSLISLFYCLLNGSLLDKYGGGDYVLGMIANGGGWFAKAILLFYLGDYILKKLFNNKIYIPFIVLTVVCIAAFLGLSQVRYVDLYASESYFAWFVYFLVMLLGMCMGIYSKTISSNSLIKMKYTLPSLAALVVFYYGWLFICRHNAMPKWEIISLLPFTMMMVVFLCFFKHSAFDRIWNGKFGIVIKFISSHCWEIYLAQFFYCFTYNNHFDRVFPFPLNIPMTFLAVFATAYAIKLISRFIVQLFNKEDFNWNNIICTWK